MARYVYPRIRLSGTDLLSRAGVIYAQILGDLLMKVDEGKGDYPKGFFHTSTTPEGEPNYYRDMWSRDVGRGLMELCRAGLTGPCGDAIEFILSKGFNAKDHYGRLICSDVTAGEYEVDGNVNILMAMYMYWAYTGRKKEDADRFLRNADSVFGWFARMGEACPYGFLLPSCSELSGNPDTGYRIYAVYATYGAVGVLSAYADMAHAAGDAARERTCRDLRSRFEKSMLETLVSLGPGSAQGTKTPAGVWLNGLDERTGKAAEIGDFGPRFFIHRWTRQLPFVQDYDRGEACAPDPFVPVNEASYRYLKAGMVQGYWFRKYGFVSCTCFTGMGDRHDDTMAGYGQNLFSQAALMSDDVNVYTKCLDGISRLAYDGDIVDPLTPDRNPWVMHECFTYENYEQGLDHTYGRTGVPERFIMHNPGDEGNLVQSAETLRTYSLMAGITSRGRELLILPRLPWECTEAHVEDFPVPAPDGTLRRIGYDFSAERWKNRLSVRITGTAAFDSVRVRLGPLPNLLFDEAELRKDWTIERKHEACFATRVLGNPEHKDEITVELINEK